MLHVTQTFKLFPLMHISIISMVSQITHKKSNPKGRPTPVPLAIRMPFAPQFADAVIVAQYQTIINLLLLLCSAESFYQRFHFFPHWLSHPQRPDVPTPGFTDSISRLVSLRCSPR